MYVYISASSLSSAWLGKNVLVTERLTGSICKRMVTATIENDCYGFLSDFAKAHCLSFIHYQSL